MKKKRAAAVLIIFIFLALGTLGYKMAEKGQASGIWIAQAFADVTEYGSGEIEMGEPIGGKGEYGSGEPSKSSEEIKTNTPGWKKRFKRDEPVEGGGETAPGYGGKKRGQGVKKAFTDNDGTGWNYCSGKCSMKTEKSPRTDGTHNILRITNISCACSCVLFKMGSGRLVKKLEVTGKTGYLDIGKGNPKNYTVRCVEED